MTLTSRAETAAAAEGRDPDRGRSARLVLWLLVTGFVSVQLAWLLAVPAFRGSDEFDHAYRAAAVARGEWAPPVTAATRGAGAIVSVPADIVVAAGPQCSALPYTSDIDCEPGRDLGDGMVSVASGAGRYHPAYYAAVGVPALSFEGAAALYVMRLATIAICAALFAAAAWSLLRWARGPWPILGLMVAVTPVLVYSTSIVAPNGVEMLAGVAVWTGLWGLLRGDEHRRGHLAVATIGAVTLVSVRSLGPLWLALVVVALLVATGRRRVVAARLRQLARWRPAVVAFAITAVVGLSSCAWILAMRSLSVGHDTAAQTDLAARLTAVAPAPRLWVLQSIAAFPTRLEPAPFVVYATGLVAFLALGALALVRVRGRLVVVAAVVAVASIVIPFVITVATYAEFKLAWQGRYTLPLSVGIPLLLALALDRQAVTARVTALAAAAAGLLLGIAHAVSAADVTHTETVSPLADTGSWPMPPVWLVSALAAVGVLLMCWAVWKGRAGQSSVPAATGTPVPLAEPAQT